MVNARTTRSRKLTYGAPATIMLGDWTETRGVEAGSGGQSDGPKTCPSL